MYNTTVKSFMVLVICFVVPLNGHAQDESPSDIVHLFNQCYGTARMDELAEHTTAHFRNNKPKSVWIADTWKVLKQIAYKREQGAVIDSKVAEKRAAVVITTKIETAAGRTDQKEIFYLIKDGSGWLIDELRVADEKVKLNLDGLQL